MTEEDEREREGERGEREKERERAKGRYFVFIELTHVTIVKSPRDTWRLSELLQCFVLFMWSLRRLLLLLLGVGVSQQHTFVLFFGCAT